MVIIKCFEDIRKIDSGVVQEIQGVGVLETTPDLKAFMIRLHEILAPGGKATITAPYYAAAEAYNNPFVVRGISEQTLNWTNKSWREINKVDYGTDIDFEISVGLIFDEGLKLRADDVQLHWRSHYINVIKVLQFVLVKK
jgi:hypothetical protein